MAGYLAVTDGLELTENGKAVVGKTFARIGEYGSGRLLPDYAGTSTKAHSWVTPFYNQESPVAATIRKMIADATHSGTDMHIVCIGDSKTNGSGPNVGKAYMDGFPSMLRDMFGAVDGLITAEPGGGQWDDRWTSIGMRWPYVDDQIGAVPIAGDPGPFQLTFAPGFAHTGGTFWVNAATGATITVKVDGGAGQAITVPAGNGFHPVTPTVTGDSAHTYQLDSPTGFHLTVFAPTYTGPRLKVTRLGRGGSDAADWAPGRKADGTGCWDTLLLADGPDALVVGLGTNGTQGAENAADVTAIYAAAVTLAGAVVALAPGGLGGTGGLRPLADYIPMYQALWAAADTHNLPLIDFQAIIGDWPTATANGLLADVVHESRNGYAYEAAALKALLDPVSTGRATTRISNAAGKAVYLWDTAAAREQRIFGETGLRDITTLAPNITSGKLYLSRSGNQVTLIFDAAIMAGATGSSYDMVPSGGIPSGFRPNFTLWYNGMDGPPGLRRIGVSAAGWVPVYLSPVPGDTYRGAITWPTQQSWPTTLPGSPFGTIPNL